MKIALVEDNPVNRNSFIQKIQLCTELNLTLCCNNGAEFMDKLKLIPVSMFPEVVFMDIQMPVLNGIETVKIAKNIYPAMHFIMFTVFEDDDNIFEAIKAGAGGYLLKHEELDTIRESISEIIEFGGAPMSPAIARKALNLLSNKKSTPVKDENNIIDALLSEREREILQHMINGYDAKRIADLINISTLTVRKHISNIYSKLHVNSKAQVLSLAHQKNWIRSEST